MTPKPIDISKAVKENRTVKFSYYFDEQLWYLTEFNELFPVPIADIGNATFLAEDKALLFMRYMRQWNKRIEADTKKNLESHHE